MIRSKRGETGSGLQVCKNGYSLNFNLFQFAKMSRKTRLYDPGALYHMILRGNGGQHTFSMTATLVAFISLQLEICNNPGSGNCSQAR